MSIDFQLETPDGDPIEDRDAEVYLESTAGYLVARRVRTSGGSGFTVFRPDGMETGDVAKIKVGFKYFSGTDDLRPPWGLPAGSPKSSIALVHVDAAASAMGRR